MPAYDFRCEECGKELLNEIVTYTQSQNLACPSCGKIMEKLFNYAPVTKFNCGGFHSTDYPTQQ